MCLCIYQVCVITTGPIYRTVSGIGLRPLACRNYGFESRRRHGCLSIVKVVCCQVEVSATARAIVQKNPTECLSLSVIKCNNKPLHQQ
jgi:hypothetical protein